MGKLIVVTGGARSGKSSFAEQLAKDLNGGILYVATSIPFDEEMRYRVEMHRAQRPSEWETLEAYKDLNRSIPTLLAEKKGVLLDCITIMISNLIFEKCTDDNNITKAQTIEIERYIDDEICKLLNVINNSEKTFILVTNEVGMGLVPEYPLGRIFRDVAGRENQKICKEAQEVYFCVSGIPMKIK